MSSPAHPHGQRRHRGPSPPRPKGIYASLRTTRQWLQKLFTSSNCGSSDSSHGATCQQDDTSQAAQNMRQELVLDQLPEDILHHIHSLLAVQDAARAACVSHGFLRCWRDYSSLTLNMQTLGLTDGQLEERQIYLIDRVDHILKNHSGNGVKVKKLELDLLSCSNISASYVDRWLQITVNSGMKELSLVLPVSMTKTYRFPCSILSDELATSSIQSMRLLGCTFHPPPTLGCLRRLKYLHLSLVHISQKGLGRLFSESVALEQLELFRCSPIPLLKIPCTLQKLKVLKVATIQMTQTQVIEMNAPTLSTFYYSGGQVEISGGEHLQLKDVCLLSLYPSRVLSYARARLPSFSRNVKSLTLLSSVESVNTPMRLSKFLHLRKLEIGLHRDLSSRYDVFSVVSFLDASPALNNFILRVDPDAMRCDSVIGDDIPYINRKPEYQHGRLRQVLITGFCSARSLVEFVILILESSSRLKKLTLDTTYGYDMRSCNDGKSTTSRTVGRCSWMSEKCVEDALAAVEVAGKYIAGKVPPAVEFQVLGPCNRCHTGNL